MAINTSAWNERNAKLSLRLKAKSGFNSQADYDVSPNQWSAIMAICEGNRAALDAALGRIGEIA